MKKMTALLAALALLLLAAGAYGEASPDLYEIYDRTEAGMKWTGNAAVVRMAKALRSLREILSTRIPSGSERTTERASRLRLMSIVLASIISESLRL